MKPLIVIEATTGDNTVYRSMYLKRHVDKRLKEKDEEIARLTALTTGVQREAGCDHDYIMVNDYYRCELCGDRISTYDYDDIVEQQLK